MAVHQNTQSQQEALQRRTNGAYDGSTDWNKYASKYTAPSTTTTSTPKPASTGTTTASIDTSALGGGYSGGGSNVDYASSLQAMLDAQKAISDAAYEESRARLNEAWGNTESSLRSNLNATLNRLKNDYDYSQGLVRDDANKSLREAYINYMMNKKNLAQGLSAMGISGGATESNMARMFNNYGSSRNNITTQMDKSLADLLHEYDNNVSSAQQLHDSQFSEARNNFLNNLTQLGLAQANAAAQYYSPSAYSGMASYLNALANIQGTQNWQPTVNTLGVDTISTTAGNNMGSVTDYAKWKAMTENMSKQGASSQDILNALLTQGAPTNAIYRIFGAA